jgi:hypothetical protein
VDLHGDCGRASGRLVSVLNCCHLTKDVHGAMSMVPCSEGRGRDYMSTLGFILVFLATVLAGLPCRGYLNAGLFILGLFFIYRG